MEPNRTTLPGDRLPAGLEKFLKTSLKMFSRSEDVLQVFTEQIHGIQNSSNSRNKYFVAEPGLKSPGKFSRMLNAAEAKYSTLDRELLACVVAIRHFHCLVEGRAFTLYMDHRPLTYLLAKQTDGCSVRQQ